MSTTAPAAEAARTELGPAFGGELIGPDNDFYDATRALFNAMIDKRPALIARCTSGDDVAAVIRFAREHDLPLAIKARRPQRRRSRQRRRRRGGRPLAAEGDHRRPGHADRPRRRRQPCGARSTRPRTSTGSPVPAGIISTTGVGGSHARRRSRLPDPQLRS